MAEKVGDLYVDLGVRIEDAGKAAKSLANAFKGLSKSALSLHPRIDRNALSQIGKQGKALSDSLTKSFAKAGQTRVWNNLERSATAAFKGAQREAEMLDKRVQEIYRSTSTGAKYWQHYMDAANPAEAEARLAAFNAALGKSKAAAVVAAKAEAAAQQQVVSKYASLASAARTSSATAAASMDRVTAAIMRMPPSLQRVTATLNSGFGRAFDGLARSAERGVGRASSAMGQLQGSSEKAFGVIRFLAYQAISAIERMVGSFLRAGFESAAAIGYTQAALQQIQVNIEKADAGWNDLSKAQQKALSPKIYAEAEKSSDRLTQSFIRFSQNTPYALDQIQELGQQLAIAKSGLKDSTGASFDLIKVMRSLGDISSATGKGVEGMRTAAYVLQQIGQSGEIMGDDLRQLHNAIPNWRNIIASQMQIPLKDVTNDVAKSTKGINALFRGLSEGDIGDFGGVLEAQNQTVAGQFQRMVETVRNGVGQVINALGPVLQPAFHEAGNLFAGLSASAVKALNDPKVQAGMQRFVGNIKAGFSSLNQKGQSSGLFDAVGDAAKQIIPLLSQSFARARTLVQSFFKGFTAGGGAAQFTALIENIRGAVEKLFPTLQKIANNVMAVLTPAFEDVGNMIATQLLPAFNRLIPVLLPIAQFLLGVFGSAVVGAIKGVVNIVKGAITLLTGIINIFVGVLTGDWGLAWNGLKGVVTGALQAIWGFVQFWMNAGILSIFKVGLLKLLPTIAKGGWALLKGIFKAGIAGIGAAIRGLPGLLRGIMSQAIGLFLRTASAGGSRVVAFFRGLPSAIVGVLRSLAGYLAGIGKAALGALARAIVPGPVLAAVRGLATKAVSALKSGFSSMASIGSDIVAGIGRGIDAAWGIVQGAISRLTSKIPGWAKKMLGIGSPSKVMAKEVGKWIPAGIAVGITSNEKSVSKAMTDLAIKIGKAGEHAASAMVQGFRKKLVPLARVMDFTVRLLDTWKDRLEDVKAMRASYVDAFKGMMDFGSLGMSQDAEGNDVFNFKNALTDIKAARAEISKIGAQSKQAMNLGVSKDTLDAILSLGPEKAQQWFAGIISGGKAVADDVNAYFSTFAQTGLGVGEKATKAFEGTTVAAADAMVNRLLTKQAVLQRQFERLADAFTAQLIKQLNKTKGGINVGYGPKKKKPPKKAIGSMSFGGGSVIAGEHGRELIDLPPRSRIHSAHATDRMLDNGPVELSPESIAQLAAAILAGAQMVSARTTQSALIGLAVKS